MGIVTVTQDQQYLHDIREYLANTDVLHSFAK